MSDGVATFSPRAGFRFRGETYRAACGAAGVSGRKREGDGATPAGLLTLRRVLYRADRVGKPRTSRPVEPLAETDGWCDDPLSPDYNCPVRLPCAARHEALWRRDAVYDVIGVLGWNDDPVTKGMGSAIFLHVAWPDYRPTEGCVALSLPDLLRVLANGLTAVDISA